ncbi:hypothetical protein BDZ85DRAFT_264471 [Elsinoe ampelina]|uniref:HAD-like domain-containing protein n=1 Tax=Elsinoe ampelina TaxID=302913 RepID=A0A6A6G847_9PEZI|nr:hypothetical protein BDZ85DRAFT_264471 [Elsinoe ampelina]
MWLKPPRFFCNLQQIRKCRHYRCYNGMSRSNRVDLICDWDGTLTKKDTLHLVAKVAYDKRGMPLDGDEDLYTAPLMPWRGFGEVYLEAYNRHIKSYHPAEHDRTSLTDERHWLTSLRDVELSGVRAAEQAKLFHGVRSEDVEKTALQALESGDLELRPGWESLFQKAASEDRNQDWRLHILSVNWGKSFIQSVLRAAWTKHALAKGVNLPFEALGLVVRANDIAGLRQPGGSTGKLQGTDGIDIRTSGEKLATMPARCRFNIDTAQRQPPGPEDSLVIYLGDSDTDLECLHAADIGIFMQDDPLSSAAKKLQSAARRLGISMRSIQEIRLDKLEYPCIWVAHDFQDVLHVFS